MTKVSLVAIRPVLALAILLGFAIGCQTRIEYQSQSNPSTPTSPPPIPTLTETTTPPPDPAPWAVAAQLSFPSATATAVPTFTPQPTRTPAPTLVSEQASLRDMGTETTLFDALMAPLAEEARHRRADLARTDPEYAKRVDAELNQGRVNFLLFGYGESHEPPVTERAIIGSHSIISYDLRTRQAAIISLTHDIRAPEIERALTRQGQKLLAFRMDQAYNVGGFKLMRTMIEDATGLSVDFQVTFKDSVIQDLVDGVFGGVQVDVPMAFDVQPFYLEGIKYDRGHFDKGPQRLTGRQAIQFIKTVPIAEGAYDKSLEHNVRKALIFDALLRSVDDNYADKGFWLRGSAFLTGELLTGAIKYDFDPVGLVVNNIGVTATSLHKYVGRGKAGKMSLPRFTVSKYIVDPAEGDGGVQWVNANAAVNPLTKKDIEAGVYPSLDMEVPIGANPYGDLPTEYWTSVRKLVKESLSGAGPAQRSGEQVQ